MEKVTLGDMFTHKAHKFARFIVVAFDCDAEVITAFNTLKGKLGEFHFGDQADFRKVAPGNLDSLS